MSTSKKDSTLRNWLNFLVPLASEDAAFWRAASSADPNTKECLILALLESGPTAPTYNYVNSLNNIFLVKKEIPFWSLLNNNEPEFLDQLRFVLVVL